MGYPVGYLKYPEGVKRMAFEIGQIHFLTKLLLSTLNVKCNITSYFVISSIRGGV